MKAPFLPRVYRSDLAGCGIIGRLGEAPKSFSQERETRRRRKDLLGSLDSPFARRFGVGWGREEDGGGTVADEIFTFFRAADLLPSVVGWCRDLYDSFFVLAGGNFGCLPPPRLSFPTACSVYPTKGGGRSRLPLFEIGKEGGKRLLLWGRLAHMSMMLR